MRQSHLIQCDGIQCDLIFRLEKSSRGGKREAGSGKIFISITDLNLSSGQFFIFRNADDDAPAPVPDCILGDDGVHVLIGQETEGEMAVIAGCLKIHILQVLHHALGQDEEGGKHHGGQRNRENGDQVAQFI